MSNNKIIDLRKPQRYKIIKKCLGMLCLLCMVSMITVACNGSNKNRISDNETTEEATKQPSESLVVKPTEIKEPEVTAGPILGEGSETTTEPTPADSPGTTTEPIPADVPGTTAKPSPTKEPTTNSDFKPSEKVLHSMVAFTQGDYLFYKTGKLTKTVIASKNLKTAKVTELAAIETSRTSFNEFYLKGSDVYYQAEGDIYRVGIDGKNRSRLFKGTGVILGFYDEDLFVLDKKAREIIRINPKGEKTSLVKMKSIDTLEAVMLRDGIYYINKSSNNTLQGNDPLDRLYYIDFNGRNKTEIYAELDIYDLKPKEEELFFLTVSEAPEEMRLNKVNSRKVTTIHSFSKEELEAQGGTWFDKNAFTLLAVNNTQVYYGVDFNNGVAMNVYSVGTDGENHGLYLNAFDIKGINRSAYFMRGEMDGGYLKILFDCDEDPVEIYLIDLQDKSTIKFEGGYYLSGSIDVEGEYVYYCKSTQYDRYGEMPENYEFGRSKLSELKR